jgi:tight adherence protein C
MFELILEKLHDGHFVLSVLVGIATIAAILSVAMPLLEADTLTQRMKAVGAERDRIRARERERLSAGSGNKVNLRQAPKAYMKQVVEWFSLSKWLGTEQAKLQMLMAGYRGAQAEVGFLFFRLITPAVMCVVSITYVFFIADLDWPFTFKLGAVLAAVYFGLKAPELYIRNQISKRQKSMSRAFPDAMDLLLICVESGMSIEHACRKVAEEIGPQSVALAEEFTLTTAELSFLPERRVAYENLSIRTGIESAKQISTVLIQAERYGTPLGTALRTVAQESRSMRLLAAEKKAASLPPKLTVPMIIFFLPVLFAVILTPAIIQVTTTVS